MINQTPVIKELPTLSPSCFISLPCVYKCTHTNTWLSFKSRYHHIFHDVDTEFLGKVCRPGLPWPSPIPGLFISALSIEGAKERPVPPRVWLGEPSMLLPIGIPCLPLSVNPKCPRITHAAWPLRMPIKPNKYTPFGIISLKAFLVPAAANCFLVILKLKPF